MENSNLAKSLIKYDSSFTATERKFTHNLPHGQTSKRSNFFILKTASGCEKRRYFNVKFYTEQTGKKGISLRFLPTCYTWLSILLATFNYRARGTYGPSTLNYSVNGAVNAWEMEISSPLSLDIRRRRIKFIIMQLIEISILWKIRKIKKLVYRDISLHFWPTCLLVRRG